MFIAGALLNVILVILLAPLFEGIVRKLKAVIHSRKGPPITQPYIDILKLLGKEDLQMGGGMLFRIAPMISLGALLLAATLTPMWGKAPLGASGDIIVWVYIMSLSGVAVMLGAFASGNPFCYTGASREMMVLLSAEPVAIVALLTAGVKAKSLLMGDVIGWQITHGLSMSMAFAGIAFFLALQANIGKLPFDMVEADQEIADGPFMEYSGPRLALYKLAFYIRQLIFSFLLVSIFVPWPGVSLAPLALVAALVKVFVVFVLIGLIDSVNPRLRIDQAMTYMGRVLFVSLAALAFAVIGV
jgi:formate hydrogenlyase subunit 4